METKDLENWNLVFNYHKKRTVYICILFDGLQSGFGGHDKREKMGREKVEEASSGCILVTCGTFSFICGIIGLFRIWIFIFIWNEAYNMHQTGPGPADGDLT